MFYRLCLFVALFFPAWVSGQPLGGKFHFRTGSLVNFFPEIKTLEGDDPTYDRLRSYPGYWAEVNYAVWKKEAHEIFAGMRYSRIFYRTVAVRDFNELDGLIGYWKTREGVGYLQGVSLRTGYRYWLPEDGESKFDYAFEMSLLTTFNYMNLYAKQEQFHINSITPAVTMGTIGMYRSLQFLITLGWQPRGALIRTNEWDVIGSWSKPAQSGKASSSHGHWQLCIGLGFRL